MASTFPDAICMTEWSMHYTHEGENLLVHSIFLSLFNAAYAKWPFFFFFSFFFIYRFLKVFGVTIGLEVVGYVEEMFKDSFL